MSQVLWKIIDYYMNIKIPFKIDIFGNFFFNLIHNCACNIQNSNRNYASKGTPYKFHAICTVLLLKSKESELNEREPRSVGASMRERVSEGARCCVHTRTHTRSRQAANEQRRKRTHARMPVGAGRQRQRRRRRRGPAGAGSACCLLSLPLPLSLSVRMRKNFGFSCATTCAVKGCLDARPYKEVNSVCQRQL